MSKKTKKELMEKIMKRQSLFSEIIRDMESNITDVMESINEEERTRCDAFLKRLQSFNANRTIFLQDMSNSLLGRMKLSMTMSHNNHRVGYLGIYVPHFKELSQQYHSSGEWDWIDITQASTDSNYDNNKSLEQNLKKIELLDFQFCDLSLIYYGDQSQETKKDMIWEKGKMIEFLKTLIESENVKRDRIDVFNRFLY